MDYITLVNHTDQTTVEDFEKHFTRSSPSECWPWKGSLNQSGYGTWSHSGKGRNAHAWAFRLFVGDVLPGFEVDHLCHSRNCVNPSHLRAVTHKENMQNRDPNRAHDPTVKHVSVKGQLLDDLRILAARRGQPIAALCRALLSRAVKSYAPITEEEPHRCKCFGLTVTTAGRAPFTPRSANGRRLLLNLSETDAKKIAARSASPRWKAKVLDLTTRKYYKVRGAACGRVCYCDALVISVSRPYF